MDEIRVDTGRIFKSEKTDEGFLRVWMTVSRTGNLTYRNDDGSKRIEVVEPKTLFDQTSLNTVWGKPITYGHPRIDNRYSLIDSKTTGNFQKGMSQQGMMIDSDFLTVVGVITDENTIQKVESGENQVSAGYKADVVERGDGIYEQLNRRYNHFAIVPQGRAGENVKVHLDCFRTDTADLPNVDNGGIMTVTVHLDGIGYQVEPNIANAIALEKKRLDEDLSKLRLDKNNLETKLQETQVNLDKAQGELEATKTKLDEAQKQDLGAEIASRMDVWAEVLPAIKTKDQDFRADYGQSVADVQRAYLSKVHDRTDLADKSDAFVEGLYEALKPDERNDAIEKSRQIFDGLKGVSKKMPKNNIATTRQERGLAGYQGGAK
jgi:hypothetical protein